MFCLSEQFSMARNLEMINAEVNAVNAASSNQVNAKSLFDAFKSFKGEHKTCEEIWKDRVKTLAQSPNANDVNSDIIIESINVREYSKIFDDSRVIYVDFILKCPCVFGITSEFKQYTTEILSVHYDNLRSCLKGFGYQLPSKQKVDISECKTKLEKIFENKIIDFVQVFIKPNEKWICPLNDSIIKAKDEPRIINYIVGINNKIQNAIAIALIEPNSQYHFEISVYIRYIDPYIIQEKDISYSLHTNDTDIEFSKLKFDCDEITHDLSGENKVKNIGILNEHGDDCFVSSIDVLKEFINKYFPKLNIVEIICI